MSDPFIAIEEGVILNQCVSYCSGLCVNRWVKFK